MGWSMNEITYLSLPWVLTQEKKEALLTTISWMEFDRYSIGRLGKLGR
jgi:hypothetical protein